MIRSDDITLLVPIEVRELTRALFDAGVEYEIPARDGLAFDSGEMHAYIDLIKYLSPFAYVLVAYIKRNSNKRFVMTLKNGNKIDISGHNAKDTERLLEKGATIRIKDDSE
nr:hypothetical protein SYMBAF_210037 [Serratia symbiotica]